MPTIGVIVGLHVQHAFPQQGARLVNVQTPGVRVWLSSRHRRVYFDPSLAELRRWGRRWGGSESGLATEPYRRALQRQVQWCGDTRLSLFHIFSNDPYFLGCQKVRNPNINIILNIFYHTGT